MKLIIKLYCLSYRITYDFNKLHIGGINLYFTPQHTSCCLPLTQSGHPCICRLFCPRHVEEQLKLQLQLINHEPPEDAVKWLSSLTRGLLCITAQETLSSTGKAILLHLFAVHGLKIVFVILTFQTVQFSMAHMKQTKQRSDSTAPARLPRQPSK